MKKNIALLVEVLCFALIRLSADGMILRPVLDVATQIEQAYAENEMHQRAFIYFDDETLTERLVVEVRTGVFTGPFAWFLPIPPAEVVPDVDFEEISAEENVFTALDRMTASEVILRKHYLADREPGCIMGCGYQETLGSNSDLETIDEGEDRQEPEVEVWQSGETASFIFSHVSSPDLLSLVDWCDQNGYGLPGEEVQLVLEDYIDRGWTFVIARGIKDLETGHGGCVSLTFSPTDVPYFPLAISAPGHRSSMPIDLFVASPSVLKPQAGVAPLHVQANFSEYYVDLQLGQPGTEFFSSPNPFGLYASEDEIPSAGEIFSSVLANWELATLRDSQYGNDSWWLFFSDVCIVDDPNDELGSTAADYLGGLSPAAELILSRFQRSYYADDTLTDVVFMDGGWDVPFTGEMYVDVNVYVGDIDSRSAGGDMSLPLGFALWLTAKVAGKMKRRRKRHRDQKSPVS